MHPSILLVLASIFLPTPVNATVFRTGMRAREFLSILSAASLSNHDNNRPKPTFPIATTNVLPPTKVPLSNFPPIGPSTPPSKYDSEQSESDSEKDEIGDLSTFILIVEAEVKNNETGAKERCDSLIKRLNILGEKQFFDDKSVFDNLFGLLEVLAQDKSYEPQALEVLRVVKKYSEYLHRKSEWMVRKNIEDAFVGTIFDHVCNSESLELVKATCLIANLDRGYDAFRKSPINSPIRAAITETLKPSFVVDLSSYSRAGDHEKFDKLLHIAESNVELLDAALLAIKKCRCDNSFVEKLIKAGANKNILKRFDENGDYLPDILIPRIELDIKKKEPRKKVLASYDRLVKDVGLHNLTPVELIKLLESLEQNEAYEPQFLEVFNTVKPDKFNGSDSAKYQLQCAIGDIFGRACRNNRINLVIILSPSVAIIQRIDCLNKTVMSTHVRDIILKSFKKSDLTLALERAAAYENSKLFEDFLKAASDDNEILNDAYRRLRKGDYDIYYEWRLLAALEFNSFIEQQTHPINSN